MRCAQYGRNLIGENHNNTPDDERAWFRKHPQWSKSNRYAELEAWIFI